MKTLEALMEELEGIVPKYEKENRSVSKACIGWHISHSFMVLERMSMTLAQSDPAQYKKSSFSFIKSLVMFSGRIPRGRGKAPAIVSPIETITLEIITDRIASAKKALHEMENAHENGFMNHPVFGILNKKETMRFMRIHTHHHLQIIKDILG